MDDETLNRGRRRRRASRASTPKDGPSEATNDAGRAAAAESEAEREAQAELASGPRARAAPRVSEEVINSLRGVRIKATAAGVEADAAREARAQSAEDPDASPPIDAALVEDLREVRDAATRAIGPTKRYVERPRGPSAAVLAATLFLIGSALLSVSFMLTRGGLSIPIGSPEPSTVAVATVSPVVATPTPGPTATPLVTAEPTPSPTPAPPTPTPDPRLALLVPCPDKPDCYLYTVRTDDSLGRISRRFTIPVDTILELNPWITDPSIIHPGEVLTLPPPG